MPAPKVKGIDLFEIKDIAYLKANYSIKNTFAFGIDINCLAMDLGHSFRTWTNKGKIKPPKDIPNAWKKNEMWELTGVCKKDLLQIAMWRIKKLTS